MGSLINLVGQTFGRLTVKHRDTSRPRASYGRRVYWVCGCECGVDISCSAHELRSGDTKSCGCLQRERRRAACRRHGLSKTPTYYSWQAAKERCHNPNNAKFTEYGGRGIQVCERWRSSFDAFLDDMGKRPRGMTLDRIRNDGNYEPGNCRWATPAEQARNKRKNARYFWKGYSMLLVDIARMEGLPRTSLVKVVRRMPIDKAVEHVRSRLGRTGIQNIRAKKEFPSQAA